METQDEEICGFFIVETESYEIKQVVISQANVPHYEKSKNYVKHFHLESLDGPVVYKTEDSAVFQLANGSLLKRKKRKKSSSGF